MAVANPLLSEWDIAGYAASAADESDDAYDEAHRDLIAALARGLRALSDPACMRLLGPVVPGATMTQGARVPGTSYELDPVAAAFSIGTMFGWESSNDAADNLGAILAVGDYLARKAHNEGERPPTVRDLLYSMIKARGIRAWAVRDAGAQPEERVAAIAARVASAAAAARLFGGELAQIAAAVASARIDDGVPRPLRAARFGASSRWAIGDANSRGVRLALLAIAESNRAAPVPRAPGAAASLRAGEIAVRAQGAPGDGRRSLEELAASASDRFGPRQAALICERLADKERLMTTPINEFAAWLVKNG